ncbi:hypothetical protein P8C59_005190 [Phyllachora maydis]|uniref:DUF1763-domain-containing protein n=1 Tax=Phyllachora maydis TaxID=1825666 RepID=A0AAD9I562_9PEZI|nr:hypothetical protein P8C59_005190 [Phyllachora maydis]
MSSIEVRHGYHKLLAAALRAVQFSKPARFVVRDQLRAGFRDPKADFDADRVRRTVWFLNAAAQERGLEHKIVKNLIHTQWKRAKAGGKPRTYGEVLTATSKSLHKRAKEEVVAEMAYTQYDQMVAMLNETMGLCLRGGGNGL